jgi:uncharacterized repeat protein (TIGR01451 family)
VLLDKSMTLSGGWDLNFSSQSGMSTIDARHTGRGMTVNSRGSSDPIIVVNVDSFVLENGWLRGTPMDIGGGGILNQGTLNLDHCSIHDNGNQSCPLDDCHGGGGILNEGTLNLNHSFVSANLVNAGSGGGGIMNTGLLNINDSAIDSNTNGGINNTGQLTITNSAITRNYGTYGGGLSNSGNLVVNNSTIGANRAGNGGGIRNYGAAPVAIHSSTISGNSASFSGGGITNGDGVNPTNVTLQNTILAKNSSASGDPDCEYYYPVRSMGYNLLGSSACGPITATDIVNLDPLLGPLTDSPSYYPLRIGSPAMDAGTPGGCTDEGGQPLLVDQRGLPRFGRCDIGAYELQAFSYALRTSAMRVNQPGILPGHSLVFSINLTNSSADPISAVIVTDTLPSLLNYNGLLSATRGLAIYDNGRVSWTGTIDAGESITITFGATLSPDAPPEGPIMNSATVNGAGDWFSLTADVTPLTLASALGSSTMFVNLPMAFRGSSVTYAIVLANSTADAIPNVMLTDTLPNLLAYSGLLSSTSGIAVFDNGSVTWAGDIDVDEIITITFGAIVDENAPADLPIINSATVSDSRDSFVLKVNLTPTRSLAATKSASVASALLQFPFTYTVTLANASPILVPDARLTDTLPSMLTYGGYVTSTSGTVRFDNGSILWNGFVAPNGVVTLSYSAIGSQVGLATNTIVLGEGPDVTTTSASVTILPFQVRLPLVLVPPPPDTIVATYPFTNRCAQYPVDLNGQHIALVTLCVTSIQIREDSQMVFNVNWHVSFYVSGHYVYKNSDVGNRNMYITDNLGHRYDAVAWGGAAAQQIYFYGPYPQSADGSFQFPGPAPSATVFTFHDDDQHVAIGNLAVPR